ncbi:MAG TPA: LysR family transcriptional regulator [Candidatus Sulfotelmatobacter sp.]|jgi:DNA-binding transcriptional LysR family regulator|nr:LysR family transcriptional regulator [Candidatus Sulfotelmatobacter sp.]
MELSDLLVFRTVVEAGGVTRAASRLNRVQSNVTARIRKLEEDLGVDLFDRQGRGVQLSPAGARLLPYAERLLEMAAQAREAVGGGGLRGGLRLGSMESTAAARLPEPLAEFHRRYPQITLELAVASTAPLIVRVLQGDLDAALVAGPLDDSRLEQRPVYVEQLVVVSPSDSMAERGQTRTLLALQRGCTYRTLLEDWARDMDIIPDRVVEMSSNYAILGCIAAGMGIGLLPRSLVESSPGKHAVFAQAIPGAEELPTVLIWRKGAPLARIEALLDVLTGGA